MGRVWIRLKHTLSSSEGESCSSSSELARGPRCVGGLSRSAMRRESRETQKVENRMKLSDRFDVSRDLNLQGADVWEEGLSRIQ